MKNLKWMRCVLAVVLCVVLALSTTACSQPINIESGTVSPEYPVKINEITIDAKPQKVAVLSGNLADIILAIGYETSLVLASEDCTQPDLQILQKISASDSAAIIESGADLVLAETMDDSVRSALEDAGISVILLERAKNREDFERLYSEVGMVLNGNTTGYNAGIKAAQKIFSSLDDLARLVPETNTVVTACYISDLDGKAVTGDQLGSVMMSYMGLTNIFKGLEGGTFTYEDLKLSNPTMIFCPEEIHSQILSDKRYAELSAVQNKRVYPIDPHYMDWQGRTVYTASIEMMGLAYPELTEYNEASVTMDLKDTESSESSSASESSSSSETSSSSTSETSQDESSTEYEALNLGDNGDDVLAMQKRLSELGYLTVEYDGAYGNVTAESVKAFQKANKLDATGNADVKTLTLLFSEKAIPADGTANKPSDTETSESSSSEAN